MQNYTQVEIFYVDDSDEIQEWYFREQDIPSAQTFNGSGIMSTKGWKTAKGSRLAAYWPSVILQDDKDQMQEAYYANLTWAEKPVGLICQNHSAFAEVPYSVNTGRSGGEKLIYQRDDQKLLVEERNNLTDQLTAGESTTSLFQPLHPKVLTPWKTQMHQPSLFRIAQPWEHSPFHEIQIQMTTI